MVRIAICDDEKDSRTEITAYCKRYAKEHSVACQMKEYINGEAFLEDEYQADILLLDIEMQGIDGVRVKEILGEKHSDTRIIFISSHAEAIPEAFGRYVFGFLKKPVGYESFCLKLNKVMAELLEDSAYMLLETLSGLRKIMIRQIMYIQAEGKYTRLFLEGEGEYLFSDKSIGTYKAKLGAKGFYMCHRSYLVHYAYIDKIEEDVILHAGVHVPMSRRMEKEFRENYKAYIWRRAKC